MYVLITPTSYLIRRVCVITVASLVNRTEDKQIIFSALLPATVRRNQHVSKTLRFLRIMAGVILMDGVSVMFLLWSAFKLFYHVCLNTIE